MFIRETTGKEYVRADGLGGTFSIKDQPVEVDDATGNAILSDFAGSSLFTFEKVEAPVETKTEGKSAKKGK